MISREENVIQISEKFSIKVPILNYEMICKLKDTYDKCFEMFKKVMIRTIEHLILQQQFIKKVEKIKKRRFKNMLHK